MFLNSWKNVFMACENYMKSNLVCISAILICSSIVCGYIPNTAAELTSFDRDHKAHQAKNIYCLTP